MTKQSYFFYDLETSGLDAKSQRIMQFAGVRTDMGLNPIGEPINVLVSLAEDVLPSPSAILVTGITPQQTTQDGYTEAEFLKLLHDQVLTPGTIITGFNSVRFDDEFMRYTLYRNFYDPYEWQWQDDRSRWDLLDVVRMTRALRPDGIEWPVDNEGNPTNRLELISAVNGLEHAKAHDALSDVYALIAVAKLIKTKQPKLYDYLLKARSKKEVANLVNLDNPQPFVYSSGRYPKLVNFTTIAFPVAPGGKPGSVIVYDLRSDPQQWIGKSTEQLRAALYAKYEDRKKEGFVPLPAKELSYNKCPAVAPVGVLDEAAQARTSIDMKQIRHNLAILQKSDLGDKLREVFARDGNYEGSKDVDGQLYTGFVGPRDKYKMSTVRAAGIRELTDLSLDFADDRLGALLLRYKARNFAKSLNSSEQDQWEEYRKRRFEQDMPKFSRELQELSKIRTSEKEQYLLQELQLWAENIAPLAD